MSVSVREPIYLDNHATTQVDPRVLEAMLPYFVQDYGNANSMIHGFGERARDAVMMARQSVASAIGASPDEVVFTSGATESNNLALRGVLEHPRNTRRRVITVSTEHPAVLDPLVRLERRGFEVVRIGVVPAGNPDAGKMDLEALSRSLNDQTALVSVMAANNEIGVLQPLGQIGRMAHACGALLHTDATQALGMIGIDLEADEIDLMSFSGHKLHGPKGVGGLYVRSGAPRIRLEPLAAGGGHEGGLRSGTLNVPGIVGLGVAMSLAVAEREQNSNRIAALRDRLAKGLNQELGELPLNGPVLCDRTLRLVNNLNVQLPGVDGQAVMMAIPWIAMSSGAACTSIHPEPSHVLRALHINDDQVRSSLRFGLSRFTTAPEIDQTIQVLSGVVKRLRAMVSNSGGVAPYSANP